MTGSRSHIVVGIVPNHADEILATAAVFARQFNADLACASVNPSRYTAAYDPDGTVLSLPLVPDHSDGRREQVDPRLAETITATLSSLGIKWTVHALAGEPARELELLADRLDARMIVVGTRDPGAREVLRELFNGSVADHLVRRQRRPVVVVPLNPIGTTPEHAPHRQS